MNVLLVILLLVALVLGVFYVSSKFFAKDESKYESVGLEVSDAIKATKSNPRKGRRPYRRPSKNQKPKNIE